MRRSRTAAAVVVAALTATLGVSTIESPLAGGPIAADPASAAAAEAPAAAEPAFTFLSAPDFMNADVANLREYWGWPRMRRNWKRRFPNRKVPNSWSRSYAALVDRVMDRFRAERPGAVLVAGDLVNGHWGRDRVRVGSRYVKTGIFGPTRTFRQKKKALNRAAKFYFRRYQRNFRSRGLRLYPAVGDHEYGDNPWSGSGRRRVFKRRTMPAIRNHFYRVFLDRHDGLSRPRGAARRTAYAVELHPDVLLISLDEFKRRRHRVVGKIDWKQLRWLRRVLARADQEWVIVQGHLPVMRRVRTTSSSALCYQGGRDSALWRTLADSGKVDLYLNGEVHDNSRRTDPSSGITQISHGGLFGKGYTHGNTAYLRGEVYGGLRPRLELTLKRFEVTRAGRWRIYQTTPKGRPVRRKRVRWVPQTIGTLTVRPGGAGDGTRKLTQYTGSERCGTKGSFRRDALPLW